MPRAKRWGVSSQTDVVEEVRMRALLYVLARMMGDWNAVLKGDVKRVHRKKAGRNAGGAINRWIR